MENILDKNNTAHIKSYEGIRDIIFKKKKGKQHTKNAVANNVHQAQQVNVQRSMQPNSSGSQKSKGKAKFRDINTYQVKQKEKEGINYAYFLQFFEI